MIPVKPGFVPITELVMSYATRVSTVLSALFEVRQQKVERGFGEPVGPIELLETIYRVQWSVLEPHDEHPDSPQLSGPQVVLTSHFDISWEDYFYKLVSTGGPLLDLIFSHCVGYEGSSCVDGYEKFSQFIRRYQRPTNFMFATAPELTVTDLRYLKTLSQVAPASIATLSVPPAKQDPSELVKRAAESGASFSDGIRGAYRAVFGLKDLGDRLFSDAVELGARSGNTLYEEAVASVLHREPDFYGLSAALHAARSAHPEGESHAPEGPPAWALRIVKKYKDSHWFKEQASAQELAIQVLFDRDTLNRELQGGIVTPFENAKHAAVLLLHCSNAEALKALLERVPLTSEAEARHRDDYAPRTTLALTYKGLEHVLSDEVLEQFPREFREGMEERAGLLCDTGPWNHPHYWKRPARHGGEGEVHLAEVDVVLVLQHESASVVTKALAEWSQPGHVRGVQLLHSLTCERGSHDGFGLADQLSQPELLYPAPDGTLPANKRPNEVALGELVLGYRNRHGRVAASTQGTASPLFRHSTFMVARKMRMDASAYNNYLGKLVQGQPRTLLGAALERLEQLLSALERGIVATDKVEEAQRALEDYAEVDSASVLRDLRDALIAFRAGREQSARQPATSAEGLRVILLQLVQGLKQRIGPAAASGQEALLLGRNADGTMRGKLAGRTDNDFTFADDREGNACPFHSHIRRTNPREQDTPRIMRRGMGYNEHGESGSFFIAYNASIAEQYEVIQRWINGGNSTGIGSFQNDLLCGAMVEEKTQRWGSQGSSAPATGSTASMVALAAHSKEKPLVQLRWGMYLFVPSLPAVTWLKDNVRDRAGETSASVKRGGQRIKELEAMSVTRRGQELKRMIEEVAEAGSPQAKLAQDVWAAIRAEPGGVKLFAVEQDSRPGLVQVALVAGRDAANQVLSDGGGTFSVCEYARRIQGTLQDHYLAHDAEPATSRYAALSKLPNRYFQELGEAQAGAPSIALEAALRHANAFLHDPSAFDQEPPSAPKSQRHTIAIRDLARAVVARLCAEWFGMPHAHTTPDPNVGLVDSLERFLLISRYTFQADPGATLAQQAVERGERIASDYTVLQGPLHDELKANGYAKLANPDGKYQHDPMKQALMGAVVGFAPPAVGAIIRVLDQWIETEELWRLRSPLQAANLELMSARMFNALGQTPSPPALYRTSVRSANIGETRIPADTRVIIGLSSVWADAKASDANSQSSAPAEAWLFGGEHGGAAHVGVTPVHGCPARAAGTQVILAIAQALSKRTNIQRERRGVLSYDA